MFNRFTMVVMTAALLLSTLAYAVIDAPTGTFSIGNCTITNGKITCSGPLISLESVTASSAASSSSVVASSSSTVASSSVVASSSSSAPVGALASVDGPVGTGCDCDLSLYKQCTGSVISITRQGKEITYTAQHSGGDVYCGVFADGDSRWIAPKNVGGSIVISATTPAIVGSGGALRNGLLLDPLIIVAGMDGRFGSNTETLPLTVATASKAVQSLIKGDSWNDAGDYKDSVDGKTRMVFEHLDVLTVLDDIPSNGGRDHFRPPAYGGSKSLRLRSTANLALLPNIVKQSRPSGLIEQAITIEAALEFMHGMKADWGREHPQIEGFKAYANFPGVSTGYSPSGWGKFAKSAHWLYVDPTSFGITQAQKDELAYRIIQHGLDVMQIINNYPEGWGPWPANGGHAVGRILPALIAATLVQDGGTMASQLAARAYVEDGVGLEGAQTFAETSQIWYGADTAYPVYGGRSIGGAKGYNTCINQTNTILYDHLGIVDNGDVRQLSHPDFATEDCTTGSPEYMNIFSPIATNQAIVCSFIPGCKAIAPVKWIEFSRRVLLSGMRSYVSGDSGAIEDEQRFPLCSGGPNDGLFGFESVDCPSGAVTNQSANWDSTSYNSKFGSYMYEQLQTCVNNSTCAGQ